MIAACCPSPPSHPPPPSPPQVERPVGVVEGACCEAEDVSAANALRFRPLLRNLTARTYFRYFKVDLWRSCAFWPEDGTCGGEDCAVCECDPAEIPACWSAEEAAALTPPTGRAPPPSPDAVANMSRVDVCGDDSDAPVCNGGTTALVGWGWGLGAGAGAGAAPLPAPDIVDGHGVWAAPDDFTDTVGPGSRMRYVNLVANPEGFTGFAGHTASRVWAGLYGTNCVKEGADGRCVESRLLYRLLSGMHASVNTHIALTYGGPGVPNVEMYVDRVGRHPERLEALHFTYLVLLRGLALAGPTLLHRVNYTTGERVDDEATPRELRAMLAPGGGAGPSQIDAVLSGFDEVAALRAPGARATFAAQFANFSRLLDCVGCEKCRLWGKMQFLGLGTALKILFSAAEAGGQDLTATLSLSRNEIVALVNTLAAVAASLEAVDLFREAEAAERLRAVGARCLWVVVSLGLAVGARSWRRGRR